VITKTGTVPQRGLSPRGEMGAAPEDGGLPPRKGKGAALAAGAAPIGKT